jgi:membrane protease YdiL (CAAX protease family)
VAVLPRALIAGAGPAALLAASLDPALRPVAAVVISLGWAALVILRRPEAIGWAAVLPVAVLLTWPWVLGGDAPLGEIGCIDPLSAIVVRRVSVAVVVLALVASLARVHRSGVTEIGLRRPAARETVVALAGCLVLAIGGLWIGPAIARPFFGTLDFPVPPAALVPAVAFGIANGVLEEVVYRGTMQAWIGRLAPLWLAIGYQALVFGIVHAGPEVLSLLPVHVALLTAVGVAGGLVRWRTGSLWIPIGVHVGADIALYVGLACRAAGS